MLRPPRHLPGAVARYTGPMRVALAPLVLAALLGGGVGGPARAAPDPPRPPTEVAPLTVSPNLGPPRLAASYPTAGQALAPGIFVLKLVFDQPMSPTDFDIAPGPEGQAPHCLRTPRLLDDGRTFVFLCHTDPGGSYALQLNARPGAGGFAGASGARVQPTALAFTTTTGPPVRGLEEAMKAAGLRPIDMPVQEMPDMRPAAGS